MTQIGVLENLKMENVSLSHQLTETKHRSIKEKERIAVQLQSIEVRRVAFTPTSQPDLIRSSAPNRFPYRTPVTFVVLFKLYPNLYHQNPVSAQFPKSRPVISKFFQPQLLPD